MSNQITILFGVFFRRTFPGTSVVSTYFIGMYSTVIAWRDFIDSFENCLTSPAARMIASLSYFVAVCFVLSYKMPCGLENPFPTWNHSAFWFIFFVRETSAWFCSCVLPTKMVYLSLNFSVYIYQNRSAANCWFIYMYMFFFNFIHFYAMNYNLQKQEWNVPVFCK